MLASSCCSSARVLGRPAARARLRRGRASTRGFRSLSMPTRAAMTPNMVPPDLLPSAAALNQVMWNSAAVVGPALGGVIVAQRRARPGPTASTCVATRRARLRVHAAPAAPATRDGAEDRDAGWSAVLDRAPVPEGQARSCSRRSPSTSSRWCSGCRGCCSRYSPSAVPPRTRGRRLAVRRGRVGALIAALSSGWVRRVRRRASRSVAVACGAPRSRRSAWSATTFALALVFLAVAGGADVISAVFRNTMQQSTVPDALRGRMSAFNIFVVAGGPRIGDLEGGLVATAFTPTVSVV